MKKIRVAKSPKTAPKRVHIDNIRQEQLDDATMKAVTKAGAGNYIQAKYIREVGNVAAESKSTTLSVYRTTPKVLKNKAFSEALLLVVAYLKRYKMNQTIEAIRTEYMETPKTTGYARASEVQSAMDDLLEIARNLEDVQFEQRVRELEDDIQDTLPDISVIEGFTTRSYRSK